MGAMTFGMTSNAQILFPSPTGNQPSIAIENSTSCDYSVQVFFAHPFTVGAYCIFPIPAMPVVVKANSSVSYQPVFSYSYSVSLFPGVVRVSEVGNSGNSAEASIGGGCPSSPFTSNTMNSCVPGETVVVGGGLGGIVIQ